MYSNEFQPIKEESQRDVKNATGQSIKFLWGFTIVGFIVLSVHVKNLSSLHQVNTSSHIESANVDIKSSLTLGDNSISSHASVHNAKNIIGTDLSRLEQRYSWGTHNKDLCRGDDCNNAKLASIFNVFRGYNQIKKGTKVGLYHRVRGSSRCGTVFNNFTSNSGETYSSKPDVYMTGCTCKSAECFINSGSYIWVGSWDGYSGPYCMCEWMKVKDDASCPQPDDTYFLSDSICLVPHVGNIPK